MRPAITVVALGPGDPRYLTMQALESLRGAAHPVLRTARHPVADFLRAEGIAFEDLDADYDRYDDFESLHAAMAERLWKQARQGEVTFAVPDPVSDGVVAALRAARPKESRLTVQPGLTQADLCIGIEGGADGWRTLPATAVGQAEMDPLLPLVVTELDSAILAGEVKIRLSNLYPDEQEIWFFPSSVQTAGRPKRIALMALDRQAHYDHTVAAVIPPVPCTARRRFTLRDLEDIMEVLRAGCPWDSVQTHESLRKYMIEEAYEAASAIDDGDDFHLSDELGDVLLQVVFHASIGRQHGAFDMGDVISNICEKMIRRHPHLFADAQWTTAEEVNANWEALKKSEKGLQTQTDVLRDVARALPALTRAAKVQKKAAQVGFDWGDPQLALRKVTEETAEVAAELQAGHDPAGELGDLLIACANVARLAGVDPERALAEATDKFIRRFEGMERLAAAEGRELTTLSAEEWLEKWRQVKAQEGHTA